MVAADCETHSMERGEYLKLYEQAEQECESDYLRTCSQTTASSDNFLEDSTSCSDPDEAEPELDYDVEGGWDLRGDQFTIIQIFNSKFT